jgi:hypothetical protein
MKYTTFETKIHNSFIWVLIQITQPLTQVGVKKTQTICVNNHNNHQIIENNPFKNSISVLEAISHDEPQVEEVFANATWALCTFSLTAKVKSLLIK